MLRSTLRIIPTLGFAGVVLIYVYHNVGLATAPIPKVFPEHPCVRHGARNARNVITKPHLIVQGDLVPQPVPSNITNSIPIFGSLSDHPAVSFLRAKCTFIL